MQDRATQALVKLGLEPEWEAKFERNSYGFRPGRSCHDAIGAIFSAISGKRAYVLDADIAGCFDNIDHSALLRKLNASKRVRKTVRSWLKAGVIDGKTLYPTEAGTPQGGVISPLLANIALHGMETWLTEQILPNLKEWGKRRYRKTNKANLLKGFSIVRYADDFVTIHENEEIIVKTKQLVEKWLKGIGLGMKAAKTQITHTLEGNNPGFDFLGFNIRQYKVNQGQGYKTFIKPSKKAQKEHLKAISEILDGHRSAPQDAVISRLNPVIKGWSRYFSNGISKEIYSKMDHIVWEKLRRWIQRRHPNKSLKWCINKYLHTMGGNNWTFSTEDGHALTTHQETPIKRHIKVKGTVSPYNGDWTYWSSRRGTYPTTPPRVSKLLKLQKGRCRICQLSFNSEDVVEVHHIDRNHKNNQTANLALVHGHCHDEVHGSVRNKHLTIEEPDETKVSSPVLKTSRSGDGSA